MANYGGDSPFGGGTVFGGSESLGRQYYKRLKSLMLPGLWGQDDAALHNHMLRADAELIVDGKTASRQVEREIFPHRADAWIDAWESLLGIVPRPGQSTAQRTAAILTQWRGGYASSVEDIQRAVYDLLMPNYGFLDDFDDGLLHWRWNVSNESSISETTNLTFELDTPGAWQGGSVTAPRLYYPFRTLEEDWVVEVIHPNISPWTVANKPAATAGGSCGVVIFEDDFNATFFCIRELAADAGDIFAIEQIVNGTHSVVEETGRVIHMGEDPFQWRLSRSGSSFLWEYGEDLNSLTLRSGPIVLQHRPRYFGLFARNVSPTSDSVIYNVDTLRVQYATPWRNVEVIEQRLKNADAVSAPESIFFSYIIKRPEDFDSGDIFSAQRLIDKLRMAHWLMAVAQDDTAKCDEATTGCDRTPLGE